ncbi:hypothetical protein ACSSJ7_17090 [Escherichia coli]|uniref:hypothetical protein n=1 Tax=Escherichia coli TaxID=562 RepID=UPI003FD2254E
MNKLDIISSNLDFIFLLNAAGYSASDVVFKRQGASTDFNAGFWTFIAEQKDRYIEVSCSLSKPTAEARSMLMCALICLKTLLMMRSPGL